MNANNVEISSHAEHRNFSDTPFFILGSFTFLVECLEFRFKDLQFSKNIFSFDSVDAWKQFPSRSGAVILLITFDSMGGDARIQWQLSEILQVEPTSSVIVVSTSDDPARAEAAIKGGARGYFDISTSFDVLQAVIALVASGGTYVPARSLLKSYLSNATRVAQQPAAAGRDTLTPRQLEILALIERGLSYRTIGEQLNISPSTVAVHIGNIKQALGELPVPIRDGRRRPMTQTQGSHQVVV
jgi:DNA-binding NarL/FixJ family response regulator